LNSSLWLLVGLQLRGWLRYGLRSLQTIKGALLALVGVAVMIPWILSVLIARSDVAGYPPDSIRTYGPLLLWAYCILNVVLSTGERGIYFTPAEISILFPAPLSRRQIVLYRIVMMTILSLPAPVMLGLVFRRHAAGFAQAFIALVLMLQFMQLFAMAVALVADAAGEALYGRVRKVLGVVVVLIVVAVVLAQGKLPSAANWGEWLQSARHTVWWQVLAWPMRGFFDVFLAERLWPDFLLGLLGSLAVLGVLLGVVFALDANYLEVAAASSTRIYNRLQRLRRGTIPLAEGTGGKRPMSLPDFPSWGGIGPIFWLQATSALRGLGRFLLVVGLITVVLFSVLYQNVLDEESEKAVAPILVGAIVWISLFVTALVPFDFRGHIDLMAYLKTLPIKPWRLATGQLLTPALLITMVHWLLLIPCLFLGSQGEGPRLGDPVWILPAIALSFPFNFLVFALENVLFLFFPVRMAAGGGDVQALGRNVLTIMAKFLILFVAAVIAFLAGYVVFLLTGQVWAAVAAAWLVLAAAGAAMIPLVSWAFTIFDVGRDTPA
jgi:hypothetical protein